MPDSPAFSCASRRQAPRRTTSSNGSAASLPAYDWGTVEPELSVEQARTAAGAVTGELAAGGDPQQDRRARQQQPNLSDLFAHWMLYAKAHKKPSSATGDKWLYERYLDKWGPRRLGTIKKGDVQAHHAKIGRENGIYAANRMLALLRSMFNKADELGYRGDNPAAGIKLFKEQSSDWFLQPHELQAFFRGPGSRARHCFAIFSCWGCSPGPDVPIYRPCDGRTLTWRVDFGGSPKRKAVCR